MGGAVHFPSTVRPRVTWITHKECFQIWHWTNDAATPALRCCLSLRRSRPRPPLHIPTARIHIQSLQLDHLWSSRHIPKSRHPLRLALDASCEQQSKVDHVCPSLGIETYPPPHLRTCGETVSIFDDRFVTYCVAPRKNPEPVLSHIRRTARFQCRSLRPGRGSVGRSIDDVKATTNSLFSAQSITYASGSNVFARRTG